jgi:hypothetical protein
VAGLLVALVLVAEPFVSVADDRFMLLSQTELLLLLIYG